MVDEAVAMFGETDDTLDSLIDDLYNFFARITTIKGSTPLRGLANRLIIMLEKFESFHLCLQVDILRVLFVD